MAASIIASAMSADSDKGVHPFFTRPTGPTQDITDPAHEIVAEQHVLQNAPQQPHEEDKKPGLAPNRARSKRKHDIQGRKEDQKGKSQRTLNEIVNPVGSGESHLEAGKCISELDVPIPPRKRRRTGEQVSNGGHSDDDIPYVELVGRVADRADKRECSPQVLVQASSPLPAASVTEQQVSDLEGAKMAVRSPPKKVLRLNANGTFNSPPSKTSGEQLLSDIEPAPTKRRGRPRKAAMAAKDRRLLVRFHYGANDRGLQEFGSKINRILAGEESVPLPLPETPTKQAKGTPRKKTPRKGAKSLHPFFGGKPKQEPTVPSKVASPRKASAVTPGKLRMQTNHDRAIDVKDVPFVSALLKDRLMSRQPGAREPPWPSKEQAHVRDSEGSNSLQSPATRLSQVTIRRRKCKQVRHPISEDESALSRFAAHLVVEEDRLLREDGFHEPDPSLRVPDRLLLPGVVIARKASAELLAKLSDEGEDEIAISRDKRAHPALQRLYGKIPNVLTAYDESRGENLGWTQKYAPSASYDVLQPEGMMQVLRDWMKSLVVQAVIGVLDAPAVARVAEKPRKKRKKKPEDLDDFLVDSDEELHEMSELVEDTGSDTATASQRSIIQVVQNGTKLGNAILLSGPHGCGKTASAYALAKELGFKVFEINSSERRSGRDVLEKVGDMTENHLVQHHGTKEQAETSSAEDNSRLDNAFQQDLQTGKQGNMHNFFKAKTTSKPAAATRVVKEKKLKAVHEALKKPAKDQKQSLILLEEVDVLFRDDKEFWSTVLKLITTSKRPFIMTCNDEALVPLQAMNLHAILRFRQPSIDLATDYLLLMAAAEGHLLKRQAVESLYHDTAYDLRASIAKLDYWCQMGVGDPRGGLAWIYQRWPPGSDVDEQNRQLRVVSNNTFKSGMGALSGKALAEEAIVEVCRASAAAPWTAMDWDVVSENVASVDINARAEPIRVTLKSYSLMMDALSAADTSCAVGLLASASLDTTQPELSEKLRGGYIDGRPLLQTDERMDYSGMSEKLLTSQIFAICGIYGLSASRTDKSVDQLVAASSGDGGPAMLSRQAFTCFDAISAPAEVSPTHPGLQQSAFDGTFRTVALDLAPYVRSIVQYDQALEEQRDRLAFLTSEGDRHQTKRLRKTRAARSALEGGQRASTRRERWFSKALDMNAVLATGGEHWPRFNSDSDSIEGSSGDTMDGTEPPISTADDDEIEYD